MNLFISHAAVDREIAQAVRRRIRELPSGPATLILDADVKPSQEWEAALRQAAAECDGIVCIVTPAYVDRPWFLAEWTVFWFQNKPWYILSHGVEAARLFEPMRSRQLARLDDWRSIRSFLGALPGASGQNLDLLAEEISAEVERVLTRRAAAEAEAHLTQIAGIFDGGTANIDRSMIESVRRSGRLPQAVAVAVGSPNSVKVRQLAIVLLELGEIADAARLADAVSNRAERRTVAVRALQLLRGEHRQELLNLVLSIYASVRNPQRRDLRETAEALQLEIDWPALPDAP